MSVVNFDHPEEYLFPRWAPGSLAEAVSDLRSDAACRQADAVERMVLAGVRVREARRLWRDPGVSQETAQQAYDAALNELDAAVEAAEKWQ